MPYSRRTDEPPVSTGASLRAAVTLLICFVLGLVVVEVAQAQWGNGCSWENHCYDVAQQNLQPGQQAYVRVTSQGGAVPASGFITNEVWAKFGTEWIEAGEITGEGRTRDRFYAEKPTGGRPFYVQYDERDGPIPLNTEVTYGVVYEAQGRWLIVWQGQVVHSFGGWPHTYDGKEAGVEVGAEEMPGSYGRLLFVGPDADGRYTTYEWETPNIPEGGEIAEESGIGLAWGFGAGPRDRFSKRGRRQRKNVPVLKAFSKSATGVLPGHVTEATDALGREVWIGRTPTAQEMSEGW